MKHGRINNKSLEIDISITKSNDLLTLLFKDNGRGISGDIPEWPDNKMGFQIIHTLVTAQLNGKWEFCEEQGTKHIIKFNIKDS